MNLKSMRKGRFRILAHMEFKGWARLGARRVFHTVAVRQHHPVADELREFFRTEFTKPFKLHDLGPLAVIRHDFPTLKLFLAARKATA